VTTWIVQSVNAVAFAGAATVIHFVFRFTRIVTSHLIMKGMKGSNPLLAGPGR